MTLQTFHEFEKLLFEGSNKSCLTQVPIFIATYFFYDSLKGQMEEKGNLRKEIAHCLFFIFHA